MSGDQLVTGDRLVIGNRFASGPAVGVPISGTPLHLGYAVNDLPAAMARFEDLFGHRWIEPRLVEGDFLAGGDPVHWRAEVVKSCSGAPMVELLRGGPGSTWHTDEPVVLHHYAYASDDVDRDTELLLADGWHLDVTRPEAGSFAYFVRDGHPRVELCAPDAL